MMGYKRKSVLNRIVSNVDRPSDCFDIKYCHKGTIPDNDVLPFKSTAITEEDLTLSKNQMNRLARCIVQIWARLSLGTDLPVALKEIFANTRRGASALAKSGVSNMSELLGDNNSPSAVFDSLLNKVDIVICRDPDMLRCNRETIEKLARLQWFSKFTNMQNIAVTLEEPINSIIVNDATANLIMMMVYRVIWVVDEFGGIADYRHRVVNPHGTKKIGYWEYELSSTDVVWLVSYASRLSNSRISTSLVAIYFFILNEGLFDHEELHRVKSIGCIDPVSSEFIVIDFNDIWDSSAKTTMELVNCYKPELIDELIESHNSRNKLIKQGKTYPCRNGKYREKRHRNVKPSSIKAPHINELEDYVNTNGKTSISAIVSTFAKQKQGAVIPFGYFDDIDITSDDSIKRGLFDITIENTRNASYIVPIMLRCTYNSTLDYRKLFAVQFTGANVVDEMEDDFRTSLGLTKENATEILNQMIQDGIIAVQNGDFKNLAYVSKKISWFNRFAVKNREINYNGIEKIDNIGLSENDTALMVAYYKRTIYGIEKLGGSIVGYDLECIDHDNPYIATAKVCYVTEHSIVRLTFSKKEPSAKDILTDALCRHFGIVNGFLNSESTMAVINPRLGIMYVLADDKLNAVTSIARKVASSFTTE